jgi:hypothetical protein
MLAECKEFAAKHWNQLQSVDRKHAPTGEFDMTVDRVGALHSGNTCAL